MSTRLATIEGSATQARIYRLEGSVTHSVPGLEMLFVLDGRLRVSSDPGRVRLLGSSDILAISRCERLRIEPVSENVFFSLRVGADLMSSAFGGEIPDFDCDSGADAGKDYSELRRLLSEIACNDTLGFPEEKLLFRSRIFRLLDALARGYKVAEDNPRVEQGETGKRLRVVKSFLKDNYRSPITLNDLADSLSLTPQYLSKFLKQHLGATFHEHLRDMRLRSALLDLVLTEDTVTSIAYDNGFPNLTSFYEAAKEATGLSPADYRRSRRAASPEEAPAGREEELGFESVRELFSGYAGEAEGDSAPDPRTRREVEADVGAFSELRRPWAEILNTGFASDFAKADFQRQIAAIQSELGFGYARFQGIFSKSVIMPEGPSFAQVDKIVDFLLSIGLRPFIELGNKPEKINRSYSTYLFYEETREEESFPVELFESFLRHSINRYGLEEVNAWRFEFWAEHDEQSNYDDARIAAYADAFAKARTVLKSIAPAGLLGGPGFLTASKIDHLGKIIRALAAKGARLDFFSFYLFPYSPTARAEDQKSELVILWDKGMMAAMIRKVEDYVASVGPGISTFYVTEWNFDYSCRNLFHDTCFKAPFILQNAMDALGSVEAFAYWLASDISSEHNDSDSILYGGSGLVSRNGIRKPAYFAYLFLSRLGPRLLAKGNGYIVTSKSDTEIIAILFNFKYVNELSRIRDQYRDVSYDFESHLEDHDSLALSLKIRGAPGGKYKIRQSILNSSHGSVLDEWRKLGGGGDIDRAELAFLDRASTPALAISRIACGKTIDLACTLEPNESRLIEISLEI